MIRSCCFRCKTNYIIGDVYGSRLPMLLVCGHDMCRSCIKLLYKKNKDVICEVCKTKTIITSDYELSNIPIHYYLVGKIWYFLNNKRHQRNQDMSNLKMTNLSSQPLITTKKNCQCQKFASLFCRQCNDVYCEDCSQEFHTKNEILLRHTIQKLDTTLPEFLQPTKCDFHSKLHEFMCATCEVQICSICTIENHKLHDIQQLENYNLSTVHRLNEYKLRGNILLKSVKHYRDKFNLKVQKFGNYSKKTDNFKNQKQHISTFISCVTGALQHLEQQLFYMLDQAEWTSTNSMIKVIDELNIFIDNLQSKLNIVDLLSKNSQRWSSASTMVQDTMADIDRMVNTTYYLAEKTNIKPPVVMFNHSVYNVIQNSVGYEIDSSERYVLGCSPDILPNYTLRATIGPYSDSNNGVKGLSERPPSSVSSVVSTLSTGSNHSSAVPSDAVAAVDAVATVVDTPPPPPCDRLPPPVVTRIVKNEIVSVFLTHFNSPSDFHVQLVANRAMINMVDGEIDKHVKSVKDDESVGNVQMDNTMYAVQTADSKWHRGIVLHIYNEKSVDMYRVYCIDYGFEENLTANNIKSVPTTNVVVSIPPLAHNCALYDLKPRATTGWSNEAFLLFSELMVTKTGLFMMYPLETCGERIKVDLVWNEDMNPMSVRDAMFFLGHGTYEKSVNLPLPLLEKFVKTITLHDNIKLDEQQEVSVVLCHFISPSEFYLRLSHDAVHLEKIMKNLGIMYKPTEENTQKSYLLYAPQIGMAVAARYSIDGNWYRAKVTSLPEMRMVTVFYIDFGNSETLPWNELRVLNIDFIKIPPLAIKASLADVYPAIDGVESDKWSDKACAAFMQFSKTYNYIENSLNAVVHEVDGYTHKIILYNPTTRANVCLNSKLVSLGYATTMDPGSCVFNKMNTRKQPKQPKSLENSRNKKDMLEEDEDLSFDMQRSVNENEPHVWKHKSQKYPGSPMAVVKVVSPDEIILKTVGHNIEALTESMNKEYNNDKKKRTQKLDWKTNDLCAIFIKKYGNWYRGKIVNIDITKKIVAIYFYDLNETLDKISINALRILEKHCAEQKCGILHCALNNILPSGVDSDGVWPKYTCDCLIEILKKYSTVYFSRQNSRTLDIAQGEIWVREIKAPSAIEPIRQHWINVNKLLQDLGLAKNLKQHSKRDDEINPEFDSEFDSSFEVTEENTTENHWLPPAGLVESQFKATVLYVDMQCHVYLQTLNEETVQSLQHVCNELNEIFGDSEPEPMNVRWVVGQSVIAQYHLDKLWYRGTIIKIENGEYSVQFLDYGNIDTCKHESLRSTLYMTDVPQLCIKAYFSTILPKTKSGKWRTEVLDTIHTIVVEKTFTVTIDHNLTTHDGLYAIKVMKDEQMEVVQFLVNENLAYYEYVSASIIDLVDDLGHENNESVTTDNDEPTTTYDYNETIYDIRHMVNDSGKPTHDNNETVYDIGKMVNDNGKPTHDNGKPTHDNNETVYDVHGAIYNRKVINDDGVTIFDNETTEETVFDNRPSSDSASAVMLQDDDEEDSSYSKFYLGTNEVVEGNLGCVTGPTSVSVVITKISGVDLTKDKDKMHIEMHDRCDALPLLDCIVPGTAVVVNYNALWRRGVIEDDGNSVLLVDLGVSTKLMKKNLKLCPAEFLKMPMFSIDCELENYRMSDDADAKNVIMKLTKLLRGAKYLKIVGLSELDNDVVGVELYDDNNGIAYQPLIDAKLLIPA